MNNHIRTPPNSTLLGRLRATVEKVLLILRSLPSISSSSSSWPLISSLLRDRPRLSLADRRTSGLIDACDIQLSESECYYDARSASSSAASTPTRQVVRRPDSPAAGEEDIDRKAEDFIENFYRQLRLEKQVSLELRYCRGHSFGSSSQNSPYSNLSMASPTS